MKGFKCVFLNCALSISRSAVLFLLALSVSFLSLVSLFTSEANAVDFSIEVVSLAEYSSPSFSLDGYNYKIGLVDLPSSYVGAIHVNTGSSYPLTKGDFVQVNTTIVSNGVCNSTDVVDLGGSSARYPLLDMKIVGQQSYNGSYCATIVNTIYRSEHSSSVSIYTFPAFFQNNAGSKFHQVRVNSVSFFRYNGSSQSNLAPILEYINNFHKQTSQQLSILFNEVHAYRTETGNKLDAINSALGQIKNDSSNMIGAIIDSSNQAHKDSQDQLDAINKQTEQDKNQYEQDKQEEQDRENQGSEDMGQATGIFNFNILNPFAGLWELFSPPTTCANIPIISGWLNSPSTSYCSWFPSSIRSVLTPVFGLSSMMLLFGFIVRWLSSSSGKAIELGWHSTFYGKGTGLS